MHQPRRYSAAVLLRQVYQFLRSAWDGDARRTYRHPWRGQPARARRSVLALESLEDRYVPSTLISATTLGASDNAATYGQVVTFSASVTAVSATLLQPSGTVTFTDGATTLGTAAVVAGTATLTVSSLDVGSHTINATFDGDLNFQVSAGSAVTEDISPATLSITTIDATKDYGQVNPVFSVGYAGFVNGDDATALGGTLSFTTAVDATSG